MAKGLTEESPLLVREGQIINFIWTNVGTSTDDEAPDTNHIIDCRDARSISIQFNTTHASNVSTDSDLNIVSSMDGITFDTVAYTSYSSLGDAAIVTFLVTPGIVSFKLTADNNDGSNAGYYSAKVFVDNQMR